MGLSLHWHTMRGVTPILLELSPSGSTSSIIIHVAWRTKRLCRSTMEIQRCKPNLFIDVIWLLYPVSGGPTTHGAITRLDGYSWDNSRSCVRTRNLRYWFYYVVLP